MPRQRIHYYSRFSCALPGDFSRRLERFRQQSGLSWAELARPQGDAQR